MNKLFDIKKYFKIKNISLYFFVILILTSFTLTYILLIPGSNLVKDNSNIIRLLILDIVLVVSLILNNTTYPPYNEENALEIYLSNINQDNTIDVLDVVMLVDIILNS